MKISLILLCLLDFYAGTFADETIIYEPPPDENYYSAEKIPYPYDKLDVRIYSLEMTVYPTMRCNFSVERESNNTDQPTGGVEWFIQTSRNVPMQIGTTRIELFNNETKAVFYSDFTIYNITSYSNDFDLTVRCRLVSNNFTLSSDVYPLSVELSNAFVYEIIEHEKNDSIQLIENLSLYIKTKSFKRSVSSKELKGLFTMIDTFLNIPERLINNAQRSSYSASSIITSAEQLLNMSSGATVNISLSRIQATSFNMFNTNETRIGVVRHDDEDGASLETLDNSTDLSSQKFSFAVFINPDTMRNLSKNSMQQLRLSVIVYSVDSLFKVVDVNNTESIQSVNASVVIAVNTNMNLPVTDNNLVSLVFNQTNSSSRVMRYQCVFWDFELNFGYGNWSTYGCSYSTLDNKLLHVCQCNHTTNFAMLINIDQSFLKKCTWCADALDYISKIGAIASIVFLTCAIAVFLHTELLSRQRKKKYFDSTFIGMHYHYHKLFITLSLNLIIQDVMFLLYSFLTANQIGDEACETLGILLHFALVSSFFLMTSMSVLRYLMTLQIFKNITHFNLLSISCSYALAGIIVFISVFSPPGPSKYITDDKRCWFNDIKDQMFAIVPMAVLCVFNLILFLVILVTILQNRMKKAQTEFEMMKFLVGTIFICGLTWLFGVTMFITKEISDSYLEFIWALIFCLLNSFQGVYIFIVAVVLRKLQLHHVLKILKLKRKNKKNVS